MLDSSRYDHRAASPVGSIKKMGYQDDPDLRYPGYEGPRSPHDGRDTYRSQHSGYDGRGDTYDSRSPRDRVSPSYMPNNYNRQDPDDNRDRRDPYDDRHDPYDDRDRHSPYDDKRSPYDDKRSPYDDRRGPYDDRRDNYHQRDNSGYYDRDPRDDRHSDPRSEPLSDHRDDPRSDKFTYNNGYNGGRHHSSTPPVELGDIDLDGDNPRWQPRQEPLKPAPTRQPVPMDTMTDKKPNEKKALKNMKTKWKKKSKEQKKKWYIACGILTFFILCIIIIPCALFVRLYHKLTWSDIVNLQVSPRDIKWGQNGKYIYYKDINNNIISQSLIEDRNGDKEQKTILDKIYWNNFDAFDITGPANIIILAKNKECDGSDICMNGLKKDRHIQYVDLYKFVLAQRSTNKEVEKFLENVQCWEILSHPTKDRIVFVKDWNIYIQELGPEMKTTKQIGNPTGSALKPRGVLPWLYSEEFYHTSTGFWQSPNGDYLFFMESDETYVNKETINIIGSSSNVPKEITYPKPKTSNPVVLLKMYNVELAKLITGAEEYLDPSGKNYKHYIVSVSFPSNTKVLIEFMNRQQTRTVTEACTMSMSPECHNLENLRRESYKSWLDRYPTPGFLTSSSANNVYYTLRPVMTKGSNYTHIHRDISQSARNKLSLTNGEYDVTEIVGTDYTHTRVLYIRTEEMDIDDEDKSVTHKRMLYMLRPGTNSKVIEECISCKEDKNTCNVVTAFIDSTKIWYSMTCLGPSVPYIKIKKFSNETWQLYAADDSNKLYDNAGNQARIMQKKMPWTEYTQVEIDKNRDTKRYVAIKKVFPLLHLKHANIVKYPLILWVNGAPNNNMAIETFELGLAQAIATNYSSVVCYMDVKGTPGRGQLFHHAVYKDLEKIVTASETSIKDIKRWWHVLDSKIAIMGSGFGGWLALRLAERNPDLFKAVVVMNPIISFANYNSAFSERYLELYDNNVPGYANTVIQDAMKIKSSTLLLLYSEQNYNIPYTQHTKLLIAALTGRDIDQKSNNLQDTDLSIFESQKILNFLEDKHIL